MAFNQVCGVTYVWPFQSSDNNRELVEREYHCPILRYFSIALGDELPFMRDDLIRRKNNGEGFWLSHLRAWLTFRNWKYDPENEYNELNA